MTLGGWLIDPSSFLRGAFVKWLEVFYDIRSRGNVGQWKELRTQSQRPSAEFGPSHLRCLIKGLSGLSFSSANPGC